MKFVTACAMASAVALGHGFSGYGGAGLEALGISAGTFGYSSEPARAAPKAAVR